MKSKIGILLSVVFILLISGLRLPAVFAYTQTLINDDLFATGTATESSGWYITETSPSQLRLFKHSSGKIVLIRNSVDIPDHPFVVVTDKDGNILGNVDIYGALYPTNGVYINGGFAIAERDSNNVIIFFGTDASKVVAVKFNINSYAFTKVSVAMTFSGAEGIDRIGNVVIHDGVMYLMVEDHGYTSGTGYAMIKYTISSDTIAKAGETNLAHWYGMAPPYMFYYEETDDIYALYSDTPTATLHMYGFDIGTSGWTDLGTCPSTGHFPSQNAFQYGYGNFINYYGGGVYHVGTYYYLYQVWSYCDKTGAAYPAGTGVRYVDTNFWYMKFNNSISSGTLLSQALLTDAKLDSSLSTSTFCGLGWGYLYHSPVADAATFNIYTYYEDIYLGKYVSKVTYLITDLGTDPTSFTSEQILQGQDNLAFKFIDFDAQLYNDIYHGISYHHISDNEAYIVTGGMILGKTYTFSGSYAPADSPLLTNKNYVMTYNIFVNGVADDLNETAKIYVDGVERITKSIPSSGSNVGRITFNMMVGTAGIHSVILRIYNDIGVYQILSGEYSYTFVASTIPSGGVPSPPTLIGYYSDIFLIWLPIGIIVFLPLIGCTMLGAKYAGGAGAITGMIFGGATGMIGGTVVGIIPTYTLYLLVILIATAIVVLFVRDSGGGGSGKP